MNTDNCSEIYTNAIIQELKYIDIYIGNAAEKGLTEIEYVYNDKNNADVHDMMLKIDIGNILLSSGFHVYQVDNEKYIVTFTKKNNLVIAGFADMSKQIIADQKRAMFFLNHYNENAAYPFFTPKKAWSIIVQECLKQVA